MFSNPVHLDEIVYSKETCTYYGRIGWLSANASWETKKHFLWPSVDRSVGRRRCRHNSLEFLSSDVQSCDVSLQVVGGVVGVDDDGDDDAAVRTKTKDSFFEWMEAADFCPKRN